MHERHKTTAAKKNRRDGRERNELWCTHTSDLVILYRNKKNRRLGEEEKKIVLTVRHARQLQHCPFSAQSKCLRFVEFGCRANKQFDCIATRTRRTATWSRNGMHRVCVYVSVEWNLTADRWTKNDDGETQKVGSALFLSLQTFAEHVKVCEQIIRK